MIPTLDPNPLPAPYWVFKLLLLVTFALHILAMNLMLGGGAMALLARRAKSDNGKRLFSDIARKLPTLLAGTISIGIAPLLFLQVLYGQFFYTSSIIMAWPWFLVLPLVIVAYYGFYYVSFHSTNGAGNAGRVLLFSVALVCLVGFIYSNTMTLGQTPARWAAKYFATPGGWNLNLSEPTLIPRFLHFFISAIAVGGLLLVFLAWAKWKSENAYARYVLQFGGKAFMFATMAQFLVGFWFMGSLPRELIMLFMGGNKPATVLLIVGFLGAMIAIFLMSDALRKENIRVAAVYVSSLTALVVVGMVEIRSLLRDAYLKPYLRPDHFAVRTQWSVFSLFLVLFVGGVMLWFVMLARYKFSQPSSAKTGEAVASRARGQ